MSAPNVTANQTAVSELYVALLGRNPDQAGYAFWVDKMNSGTSQTSLASAFAYQPEFYNSYAALDTTTAVGRIYTNVFSRPADTAGSNYWSTYANNLIAAGSAPVVAYAQTATAMVDFAYTQTSQDGVLVQGKVATATATGTAQPVTTYTLTTGIDAPGTGAFAAAPSTIADNSKVYGAFNNGTSSTLTAGDNIQGTSGSVNSSLILADATAQGTASTLNTGAITVANIPNVTITSGTGLTANVKSFTGLTSLTATTVSGGGAGADVFTAAATTNAVVTDAASGVVVGGVTVNGGNNVTITESGNTTGAASTITVGGTTATNPAGTETITVSGSGGTIVVADGGTTVSVTDSQSGAITIGANTAPTGAVTVTDTNGVAGGGTITISGGASATVTDTAAVSATTGVLGIANAVVISGVTGADVVTQTAVTGAAITVNNGSTVTINTTGNVGAGAVSVGIAAGAGVPTGAISVTDTNSLAASADVIAIDTLAASSPAGAVTVVTGANAGAITVGVNTAGKGVVGNVSITNQTTYSNGKTVYGVGAAESVYVNGATAVTLSGGTADAVVDNATTAALTTLSLTGVAGSSTAAGAALTTFTINNAVSGAALTVTGGAATHSDTVNISGDTGATAPVFSDITAKAITVIATGAANGISVTDTLVGKHNYTFTNNGTGALTLKTLTDTGNAAGSTVTVNGTGATALGTNFESATSNYTNGIAVTGTGAVSAQIYSVQSFAGGTSTGDTVTLDTNGATSIAGSIVGGSGGNNTLVKTDIDANYAVASGGALSGFQNLTLATLASGQYTTNNFAGNLGVSTLKTSAAVEFDVVRSNQALTLTGSNTAGVITITGTASAAGGVSIVTINGVATNVTVVANSTNSTTAAAIMTALTGGATGSNIAVNVAGVNNVYATVASNVVTLSGAASSAFSIGTVVTQTGADAITQNTNTLSYDTSIATQTSTNALALGNTANLTVNAATNTAQVTDTVQIANDQTIALTSNQYKGGSTVNTVTIADATLTANANQATTLTISGAGNVKVNYSETGTAANALATINASGSTGSVDITGVVTKSTGFTVTSGTGVLTATGTTGATARDVFNISTGAKAAVITLGTGGAAGTSGSETVNISNTAANVFTTVATAYASFSGWNTANKITFDATKTLVANAAAGQSTTGAGGTDTYSVINGVITFTGADSVGQQLLNAQYIVNTGAAGGGNHYVAAFQAIGSTATTIVASGVAASNVTDEIFTLSGVTGITELGGTTAATGNIISTNITGITNATITTSSTTNYTQNEIAGYTNLSLAGSGTGTVTLNNVGASVNIADVSTSAGYNLVVNNAAAGGSLAITSATAGHTYTSLTVIGDTALTLNGNQAVVVTSLVDSGNTLATLNLGGTGALTVAAITDTALTKIVDTVTVGAVILGTSTATIAQAGLNVTLGSAAGFAPVATTAIYLSGAADTIDAHFTASGVTAANIVLSATGAGSTVLGGAAVAASGFGETITVGATGTVTMLQGVAAAAGAAAITGDAGVNAIKVGANSVVTLGTTSAGLVSDGGSTITVTGDTAGTALTNLVTINNVSHGSTLLKMFATGGGTSDTLTLVNVASATTFAAAANLAVSIATNGATGTVNNNEAVFHWTDGNTYIIGHSGAAETALSATDVVVKLVGLDTPTAGAITAYAINL